MNYAKQFSIAEVLAVPFYTNVKDAPIGEPFFGLVSQRQQQIALGLMIDKEGESVIANRIMVDKVRYKFDYWIRAKDGNVVSRGGHVVPNTGLTIEIPDTLALNIAAAS